jgi:hypothetical protein
MIALYAVWMDGWMNGWMYGITKNWTVCMDKRISRSKEQHAGEVSL